MRVLVTGAGALLGQGIIKALRLASTPYEIIAADPDSRAVGLYWADQAHLIPFASAPDYLDRVGVLIGREQPVAVLVGTDVELPLFAAHKAEIESAYQTRVIVSAPEVIRIADDKWLTAQFLASNGFPHPRSALPDNRTDLLQHCDFPLIVKPRCGARSVGVHLVHSEAELALAVQAVNNPVIQEYVATPEHEYTSGLVMTGGTVQAIVTMRRDLRDGNTYRAYVEPDPPYNDLLARIAERLAGFGPLNFQFRLDNGVPKIFEINARFSGTTPMRAYAGYNEVDHIVRHVVEGTPIPPPRLRPVVVLRYWDEIVVEQDHFAAVARGTLDTKLKFQRPTLL
jgi:carbamoyl-phosphate synthase large subunit